MSEFLDLFADLFYPLLIGLIMFLEKGKLKDALFVFGKEMASKDEQRDKHVYQSMSLMTNPQSHGITPDNTSPPTTPIDRKVDEIISMISAQNGQIATIEGDIKSLMVADQQIFTTLQELDRRKADKAS